VSAGPNNATVTFRIPEDLKRWIDGEAARMAADLGVPIGAAHVARVALKAYRERLEALRKAAY